MRLKKYYTKSSLKCNITTQLFLQNIQSHLQPTLHLHRLISGYYTKKIFQNCQNSYCKGMGKPQNPLFHLSCPRSQNRVTTVRKYLIRDILRSYYQPTRSASRSNKSSQSGSQVNIAFIEQNGASDAHLFFLK